MIVVVNPDLNRDSRIGRVEDRVALVTGASRGQGAAHARLLAAEGASVLLTDLLDEEGTALASELAAAGHRAHYEHLDVAEPEAWERALAVAPKRELGPVTVLVGNAGVTSRVPIAEVDDVEWQRIVEVDQRGVFLGMRHRIPRMAAARSYGPDGIRANAICPGLVATPMGAGGPSAESHPLLEQIPWAAPQRRRRSHHWSSSSPPTSPPT